MFLLTQRKRSSAGEAGDKALAGNNCLTSSCRFISSKAGSRNSSDLKGRTESLGQWQLSGKQPSAIEIACR